ncbi:hypothetical protein [Mycolicibacterium lutetiense]
MATFAHFTVKTVVGAGLCVTAVALSPHAAAELQLKTGGYKCVDAAAAAPGAPVCAAPAVEAAGIVPAAAPAAVPPVPLAPPPVVPPVPLAPPPPIVPPVPLAPPPVPVVPAAAPVPAAPAPIAAPIVIAAGTATGKGVPTVSPGGGPVAGTPTLPGPADGAGG